MTEPTEPTDPADPLRLVDPESVASSRVRTLVEESRADIGTEREMRAMDARLSALLWLPGPGARAGRALGANAGSLTALKIGAAALVAGAGGLWFVAGRAPDSPSKPPTPAAVPVVPSALAREPNESAAELPDSAPPPVANAPRPQSARSRIAVSEAELLGQAQAALSSDPAHALALTEEHRREFPSGMLAQEREVIAIEALGRLGRKKQAAARADRFLRTFPNSAHRNKIESLVGQ